MVEPAFSGCTAERAYQEVRDSVTLYFYRRFSKHGGDAAKAYRDTVEYFHEGLPYGKSFATVDDTHWEQRELTNNREIEKAGNITVPSDMDEVS